MLVAFGGYNGKYHNAVSVFKLPAAGAAAGLAAAGQQQQAEQQVAPPPQRQASGAAAADAGGAAPEPPASAKSAGPSEIVSAAAAAATLAAPDRTNSGAPNGAGSAADGASPGQRLRRDERLLRDLAVQREQLKRELSHVKLQAADAQQQAAAAKEAASKEIDLLRRQLAEAQAALGDAEKVRRAGGRGGLEASAATRLRVMPPLHAGQLKRSLPAAPPSPHPSPSARRASSCLPSRRARSSWRRRWRSSTSAWARWGGGPAARGPAAPACPSTLEPTHTAHVPL
jgi:hypothetical protein